MPSLHKQDLYKVKNVIEYFDKYGRDLFSNTDQVDQEDLQTWIQGHRDIVAFAEKLNERLTALGKINENQTQPDPRTVKLADMFRKKFPALNLQDALAAARHLLSRPPEEVNRLRKDGFMNDINAIRSMAALQGNIKENETFGIRNIENEQIAEKILAVLMGKGKIPAMKGGNEKESIKAEIADVLDQVKPGMNESVYKKTLKALIREAKK